MSSSFSERYTIVVLKLPRKLPINLAVITIALCVFVVAAMASLIAAWRAGAIIAFYVVLTVALTVAAGVNLVMVTRRIAKLKQDMSHVEYQSAQALVLLVTMTLSCVVGACFAIADRVTTYPMIFSAVPVFMLFINGYAGYVESRVGARKFDADAS